MATPPDFTTGQVLTAAQMNAVALWEISTNTLNAVTNNISNVFSSDYDAYKVIISNLNNGSTTTRQVSLRYRTSSDDAGANYFFGLQFDYGTNQTGTGAQTGQTLSELTFIGSGASNGGMIVLDIINPNLACATMHAGWATVYQSNVTSYVMRNIRGGVNTNTQYTGFSIIGTTDNLSGTVRVYGYRK